MSFKEVAKIDSIPQGTVKGVELDGQSILLANLGGKYYAVKGKCPHMGGDLSKGKLDGNILTCPRHGSKYDLTTGKNMGGPKIGLLKLAGKDLPAYKVKLEGGAMLVDMD